MANDLSPSLLARNSIASSIAGQGEMADLVRQFDWAGNRLGPVEHWSETLRSSVNTILASPLPMQLFWGPAMVEIYNDALKPFMAGKHPQALGQPAEEVWREAWPQVGDQLKSVLQEGTPVRFNGIFLPLLRNGVLQDMYWDYSYSPVYGSDGSVAGILNIAQDVTEAVAGRLKLQASEAQAQRILRSIGDAVIVTDANACVTRMNTVAEELTGWSEGQARNVPLTEVFNILNESTRLPVESPAAKVQRLGTVVGLANHTILKRRNGTEIHIDDSGAPIRDESGALTGIVLVFRDIGERRAAERERDEALAELRLITDSIPAAISYLDPDRRYVRANRRYEEWFGTPIDKIAGCTTEEVLGLEAAAEVEPHLTLALSGQPQRFELRVHAKGEERILDIAHTPHIDEDRNVRGVIVQGYDVTEQKRAEAALIQSEKLAAVGRLAASIAHEINNPLESVTNLLYLARGEAQTEHLKTYLDTADRELRRVAAITNQTLRFHKQSTRPTQVTCEELLDGVTTIYQGRIVNSRVAVERRKRAKRAVLCFDGEIRQVLSNLVGNAIDAMHPNGGRLLLRSHDGICWHTGRRGLVITVADSGPGMSEHTMAKAFEPFFTTKGIGGTGLGLWISQEIMKRHHGWLTMKSRQGQHLHGTAFRMFLPYDAVTR